MKKTLTFLACLLVFGAILSAQTADPLVSKCAMTAGNNTTYLKVS